MSPLITNRIANAESGRAASSEFLFTRRDHYLGSQTFPESSHLSESPPLDDFVGRFQSVPLHSDSLGTEAIQMMKRWLSNCRSHENCSQSISRQLPTLVIDVSSVDRLYLRDGGRQGEYCFYSGCWGRGDIFMLRASNIDDFRRVGIASSVLPESWRDAAELTRSLGFDFLWIDGLCIMQDTLRSWDEEAARITDYVRDASLVIASTASDVCEGLRQQRSAERELLTLPYIYKKDGVKSGNNINGTISIRRPMEESGIKITQSVWARRGWTLPERYFAQRMVIFGDEQIYWNCTTNLFSEASTMPQEPLWKISCLSYNNRMAGSVKRSTWYNIIEYYTSTALLNNSDDRLMAMAGLAMALADEDRYYAGIWGNDLEIGLLWRRRGPSRRIYGYCKLSYRIALVFHTSDFNFQVLQAGHGVIYRSSLFRGRGHDAT